MKNRIEHIGQNTRTVFFVIDNSGRMYGCRMEAVNRAMEEMVIQLQALQNEVCDEEQINIAVLTVGDNHCRWMNESPIPVCDFYWEEISASGISNWKIALEELNYQLNRTRFLLSKGKLQKDPIIIFVAMGEYAEDWHSALVLLNENKWYSDKAIKAAVAIEDWTIERMSKYVGPCGRVFVARSSDEIGYALRDCLSFAGSCPDVDSVAEEEETTMVYSTADDENIWNTEW